MSQTTAYINSIPMCGEFRKEKVYSTMLLQHDDALDQLSLALHLPEDVMNVENWILEMALLLDWHNWQDLYANLTLPQKRMMVLPLQSSSPMPDLPVRERLRAALILAQCNTYMYLPQGPRIFTRSRLHRNVRLIDINLEAYYELD